MHDCWHQKIGFYYRMKMLGHIKTIQFVTDNSLWRKKNVLLTEVRSILSLVLSLDSLYLHFAYIQSVNH